MDRNDQMEKLIGFLAAVLGGAVPIKPVRLTNLPSAFGGTFPQNIDNATQRNFDENFKALWQYAVTCGLIK